MLNMLLYGERWQVTVTVITASLLPVSGSLSTMTGGFSLGIMVDNSGASEGGGVS